MNHPWLAQLLLLDFFNAHLGCLGGCRGGGDTNIQGVIVNDMIGRCNLNAISLGSAAVGSCYTYASGDTRSIVDYILADEEATNMLHQCCTLPFEDLNISDHLPLIAEMMYVPVHKGDSHCAAPPRIDWKVAVSSGDIANYQLAVSKSINSLANNI